MFVPRSKKIEALQECIHLLKKVDMVQQRAFGGTDVGYENSLNIQDMIVEFEADLKELQYPVD